MNSARRYHLAEDVVVMPSTDFGLDYFGIFARDYSHLHSTLCFYA
jgi:hypothetical protein